MLTFKKFTGINNVLPETRLSTSSLRRAEDVDIDLSGALSRRAGFAEVSAVCHKNLWQANGFMLATVNNDLMKTNGATQTMVYPSLGVQRVWYCNLPDGRTTFSNGLINGITDGTTTTTWGVPIPSGIGALTGVSGSLFPGDYQYAITYVRNVDGLEGPPAYSNPVAVPDGGVLLTGLPTLAGHTINVYLTSVNGGTTFKAGNTATSSFSYLGKNSALVLPCPTDFLHPMPLGTVTAFWRGRVLVADGKTLWASLPQRWELCDMRRDFKQFSAPITLIQPVDDGLYVGTTKELAFLSGTEFDKLSFTLALPGPVVLGSGVEVPGELIKLQDRVGEGRAMVCIADSMIVAGFNGGNVVRMTEGVYQTSATEVAATFRKISDIPQYIAIPQ
jgi:hypothetical protein